MRTLLATTLIFSLLALGAAPQDAAKPSAPAAPHGPALTGDDGKPVAGVRVAKVDVKTVIHGTLAQATMTLTFANDLARVLGGNLFFPLPEGATVTGYGLEINGRIVDGVAVEKERARIIYESELHKRIDPGLVENVEGNAFRTRLYPIPANGTRSIKIEYVTQIEQAKDGPSVSLPLGMSDVLDELSIHVEAPEATAAPSIKAGGMDGLAFAKGEHGFVADASAKKAKAGEELVIALPELAAKSVAVEKRAKYARTVEELEQHDRQADARNFENYFTATDTPAIAARPAVQLKNQRVGVVWDASLSRGDMDHARELKLLSQVLDRLGNPSTDLIVLRNDVQLHSSFANAPEGTAKLIEVIKSLPYDGATALGSVIFPKNASDFSSGEHLRTPKDYDLYLLFTDGFGNLGPDRPLRAEVPVYAMSDAPAANHSLLRALCQESGGSYFNLKRASDEQVLAGVGDAPFSLVSIECKPQEIAEVYPPIGTAINGRFTISGKLLVPEATLTLHYGYGKEVTGSATFTISSTGAAQGTLLPRFWAQQKIAALSLFPDKNGEAIAQLGKQFNLVTPKTSLLVLESVDQYVQYRVVPPQSQPEIYKEFLAKIEEHHAAVARTQEEKMQQVAAMWNARVQWWEQEHKYAANLKVNQEGGRAGEPVANANQGGFYLGGHVASAPEPAPGAATTPTAGPRPTALDDISEQRGRSSAHGVNQQSGRQQQGQGQAAGQATDGAANRPMAGHASDPAAPVADSPARQPSQGAAEEARREEETGRRMAQSRQRLSVNADDSRNGLGPHTAVPGSIGRTATSADDGRPRLGPSPAAGESRGAAASDPAADRLSRVPDPVLSSTLGADRIERLEKALKDAKGGESDFDNSATIQIKTWDPKTPYIAAMKAVGPEKAYDVYLAQRKDYAKSPAFYFDCADYLVSINQRAMGIRVLTDIVELELHDARLLRVAAHRLNQIGERELAIDLFEKVLKLRPEEPQSDRDLALTLADRADSLVANLALANATKGPQHLQQDVDQAMGDYTRSLELLNKVVQGNWPRFPEVELPVLMEANDIAFKASHVPSGHDFHNPLDARLQKNLDCDVRVVMTWDADQTDIDLWVTEPSGEKCFYAHNRTVIGGLLSHDFTDGYGPEEYCLRKLMPGQYNIQANFYGSRQQELTGPATVQATVITNFGRANEKRQALTLRLKDMKEVVDVGTVTLGDGKDATAQPAQDPKTLNK